MRRWMTAVASVIVLMVVTAACTNEQTAQPVAPADQPLPIPTFVAGTTMERIQKSGTIKIGVKFDQPGFGQRNSTTGNLEGFDIELSKAIAQGIFGGTVGDVTPKINFVETVSRNRESFIENGTVDMVVATYTINNQRKAVVDFAGPYYSASGDLMVKSETANIRSVSDLNGKRVCIVRNSTYEQNVREQAPQAAPVPRDTYSQCADALRANEVEAVATDSVILAGLVQTSQGAFKLVGTSFTNEPYGVGLKKGDDEFRRFLNDRLEAIEENGDWAKIFDQTLGRLDLPRPQPPAIDRYGLTVSSSTPPAGAGAVSSTTSTTP